MRGAVWLLLAALAGGAAAEPALPAAAATLRAAYVFIGGGSGVMLEGGLLLTNHHVAGDDPRWEVFGVDGRPYQAELLGADPIGDLCLLRVAEPTGLGSVRLASAALLQVGMPALALGNPFGLGDRDSEPTLTFGHVGAVGIVRGHYADCLQFDTAVNPGNSGGPLLSLDGELLGINGQIRTRSGMRINSGIGLAIAATQLAEFVPALAQAGGGYVHHAAPPAGLEFTHDGAQVVISAVPAASALRVGDVVLAIDGRSVPSPATAVGRFVARCWQPGFRLPLRIRRAGVEETHTVVTGRTPILGRPWHGLNLRFHGGAAVVTAVDPGSSAATAGIPAGARVQRLGRQELSKPVDLARALLGQEIGDRVAVQWEDSGGATGAAQLLLRPRP
jgi:S1-C subfamily serine protease